MGRSAAAGDYTGQGAAAFAGQPEDPRDDPRGLRSQVWLGHQPLPDGTLHFYTDSDGSIVKGLLAIVLTAVEGKTAVQLRQTDPLALLRQLGLEAESSDSRADGLAAIGGRIAHIAAGS